MIPVLYPKTATKEETLSTSGLGALVDSIKCEVTEERNSIFEAVLQYPVAGALFPYIVDGALFKAQAGDGTAPQLFRIYKSSKPLKGIVTYYAEHISYTLNGLPVTGLKVKDVTAQTAMRTAFAFCPIPHEFNAYSDITTPNNTEIKTPCALRGILGGVAGSILDTYGGEFEFDNYDVRLWLHRGANNGVTLRYGKNITDLKQESNISECYTHLFPYAKKTTLTTTEGGGTEQTEAVLTLSEQVLPLISPADVGHSKALIYDFSSAFQEGDEFTEDALRTKAQAFIAAAELGAPTVNITLSFIDLAQTEDYKDIAPLERVRLCDTVNVYFEPLGITASAKVIKTVYDCLKEKYKSIEIGSVKANFADTVKTLTTEIKTAEAKAATDNAVLSSRLTVEAERISAEVTRAEVAEQVLSANITQTAEKIAAEVTRATGAETALSSRIEQTADKITAEVTRATESEESLFSSIEQTAEQITAEVTRATGAENTLSSHIDLLSDKISLVVETKAGSNVIKSASIIAAINDDESSVTIAADKINLNGIVTANGTFKIDTSGNVTATGGNIGGFTIGSAAIYNGITSITDISHDGVYLGTDGIRLGKGGAFNVDAAGYLTATKANITGTITATDGKIGGYTISETSLFAEGELSNNSYKISINTNDKTYSDYPANIVAERVYANFGTYAAVVQPGSLAAIYKSGTHIETASVNANDIQLFTSYGGGYLRISRILGNNFDNVPEGVVYSTNSTADYISKSRVQAAAFGVQCCLDSNYFSGTVAYLPKNTTGAPAARLYLVSPTIYCCKTLENASDRSTVYAAAFNTTSDRRVKREIKNISSIHADLIDHLRPRQFRYKNGDGRLHFGFIAQEVKNNLQDLGASPADYAMIDAPKEKGDIYSLAYEEFIALAVKEIQDLKARLNRIENRADAKKK